MQVAAIQMTSGDDVAANLPVAERLIAAAAAEGARLVLLPENFGLMAARARIDALLERLPGASADERKERT